MSEKEDLPEEVKTEGEVDDFLITENEPEPEPQLVRQETKEIDLRKDDPDEDIPDKNIESSKPKKKRERTEAQKAVFEKARLKRQENIAKRKAEKEANKKPVGRPKKDSSITGISAPTGVNITTEEENPNMIYEEDVIYMKKPKAKKAPKKKKKIVYVSSSESEEEEIVYKPKPKPKRKTKIKPEPEYFSSESEEEQYTNYQEPIQYRKPTSITDFYRVQ